MPMPMSLAEVTFAPAPFLAAKMVNLAELLPMHRVLEPSAGTGTILKAIGPGPSKVAVEIHWGMVDKLLDECRELSGLRVMHGDFLRCKPEPSKGGWDGSGRLGLFDRVLINPPFEYDGSDLQHILHALKFLKPEGLLVGICANQSAQIRMLRRLAETWQELPGELFADTRLRTVLISIRKVKL